MDVSIPLQVLLVWASHPDLTRAERKVLDVLLVDTATRGESLREEPESALTMTKIAQYCRISRQAVVDAVGALVGKKLLRKRGRRLTVVTKFPMEAVEIFGHWSRELSTVVDNSKSRVEPGVSTTVDTSRVGNFPHCQAGLTYDEMPSQEVIKQVSSVPDTSNETHIRNARTGARTVLFFKDNKATTGNDDLNEGDCEESRNCQNDAQPHPDVQESAAKSRPADWNDDLEYLEREIGGALLRWSRVVWEADYNWVCGCIAALKVSRKNRLEGMARAVNFLRRSPEFEPDDFQRWLASACHKPDRFPPTDLRELAAELREERLKREENRQLREEREAEQERQYQEEIARKAAEYRRRNALKPPSEPMSEEHKRSLAELEAVRARWRKERAEARTAAEQEKRDPSANSENELDGNNSSSPVQKNPEDGHDSEL